MNCEVVALQQLGDGQLAGVVEQAGQIHRTEPVGVVHHLGSVRQQDLHDLVEVPLGVGHHLLGRLHRSRRCLAGRVPHLSGEAAHHQDRGVPVVLEISEFAQHHRVPDGQVRPAGIDTQLHPQRAVFPPRGEQPFGQSVGRQNLRRASRQHPVLLAKIVRQFDVVTHNRQVCRVGATRLRPPARNGDTEGSSGSQNRQGQSAATATPTRGPVRY
jgi:hypothetical protein